MFATSDEMPPIRVPPDRSLIAEVVVLMTSLGVKRREFNASTRVRELLEILKCHHKVIDFNLDTSMSESVNSKSKVNQADLEVVRRLYKANKIKQDPSDGLIVLPQILIDGINVGDGVDLQSLEDEDLLQPILKRLVCAKCMRARKQHDTSCKMCDVAFNEIMPGRQTIDETLMTFEEFADAVEDHYDDETPLKAPSLGLSFL